MPTRPEAPNESAHLGNPRQAWGLAGGKGRWGQWGWWGGRDAMDEGPNEHWDGRARPADSAMYDVWTRTDGRWVKI